MRKQKYDSDRLIATAFLSPAILIILLFTGIPIIVAFRTSLAQTNYAQIVGFAGLDNFIEILSSPEGWQKIMNSVIYVLSSLLLVLPLGVGAALLLNREIKMRGFQRTVIILPWVLSQTVTALLWRWLLNANFGPIVYILYALTGQQVDFFNSSGIARVTVAVANVWNTFPIVLILTLAALQTIPGELYEAARVDGSSHFNSFKSITFPLILPTLGTAILMQSIEYFNMVTLIYVLTSGGPFGATETLSVKAFREGFEYWHMGLGSAYSVIIFLLNIIFSLVYIRIIRGRSNENA